MKSLSTDAWLTVLSVVLTPWLLHDGVVGGTVAGIGPDRYQLKVPPHVGVPVTLRFAVSVPDCRLPVPMSLGGATSSVFGVVLRPVFVDRTVLHCPICPR